MNILLRAACAFLACASLSQIAFAQSSTELPTTVVTGARPVTPRAQPQTATVAEKPKSLTANDTEQAIREVQQTPGGVAVVPAEVFRNTQATTIKDMFDYVPGVFVQPKWGEDTRLSIRGSGLSRNFHLRGVQLYMDGIPINTADGYGDFQEIDPTAYDHADIYKGGNGLRFGANSLGGAINFVTPIGRTASPLQARIDAGSFDFYRLQVSTGGASGPWDGFITGAWQQSGGYREHSWGHSARASMNFGYQIAPNIETRFYFNANEIRQRIPGEVDKETALKSPKTAAAVNVTNDWQRNIDSLRAANVTTVKYDLTAVAQRLARSAVPEGGVRLIGVSLAGLGDAPPPALFDDTAFDDTAFDHTAFGETAGDATADDETAGDGDPTFAPAVDPAGGPPEGAAGPPQAPAGPARSWRAGDDVAHATHGHGWVQGAGHGRVTVRFETRGTGPGRARTLAADDPALQPADPVASLA